MAARWRVVWCPHPHCTRFTMGVFTDEEAAGMIEQHRMNDCDGVRFERDVGAYETRTRIEGRWQRVARRWGLPAEEV